MELGLTGRRVLISGAASGIGRACALAFAEEGAAVALIDMQYALGRALATELAERVHCVFVHADVSDESELTAAVDSIAGSFGGIDVVVGCAGISGQVGAALECTTVADFNRVLAVNVTGQFLLARQCAPYLRRATDPAVILMASDSSFVAVPGMVPYNASKGAVLQLSRALSVELAPAGIRVNCVCPSIVDTAMSRADLGLSDGLSGQPFPVQTAEQVANHVLYLASSRSRPVNGAALVSDFGYLARSAFPA